MGLASKVWDATGADSISRRAFYFVMGVIITWSFILTYFVAKSTANWHPDTFTLIAVGLAMPLLGAFMSCSSNALLSFVGLHFMVIGLSAILGPGLSAYEFAQHGIVQRAALATACTAVAMGASGVLFPNFYSKIGGVLFGALIALVVLSFARIFIPGLQDVGIIDYCGAGLFSLYIGYDMWRASSVPATFGNAIQVAASLYLDLINLFLYLLRIFKK